MADTVLRTLSLVMALVVGLAMLGATPAWAETEMLVTTSDDVSDANPADGVCDDGAGRCSVRAAVEQANAMGGAIDITVPAGTYALDEPVGVTADVALTGEGPDLTHLRPTVGGIHNSATFLLAQGSSIALHQMSFADPTDEGRALTEIAGSDASVLLADLHVHDVDWTAMFAEEGLSDRARVEVVRSTFTDVQYPIFFAESAGQYLDVSDSTFLRSGYSAVFIDTISGQFRLRDSEILDTVDGNGIELWNNDTTPAGGVTLEVVRTRIAGSADNGIRATGRFPDGSPTLTTRIIDSELSQNASLGIYVDGDATIERSTLRDNDAGGGMLEGPTTIAESTFSGNGEFGAELNRATYPVEVVNSTFSGTVGYAGLAVYKDEALLRNVTITGTQVESGDGALHAYDPGIVIENTVIAGNTQDCAEPMLATSGGHNADSDGTCGFTQPTDSGGIDPQLAALADNGGPTRTHEPLPGSPLIDGGSNATCPATDQRGAGRPADGTGDGTAVCDIGAVEVGSDIVPGDVEVEWSSETARRGLLRPDGQVDVTVTAAPGGTAVANVAVRSWYADGDVSGTLLDAPADTVVSVALDETSAGTYEGALDVWGVERVTGIVGVVQHGDEARSGSTTEQLPAMTAGALDVVSVLDVAPWSLPNPRVVVRSATTTDGDALALPHDGTVTTRWLRPSDDYTVQVIDAQNRVVAALTDPTQVRGGLQTSVDLALTPRPFIPFAVELVDVNGHPQADAKVTVTDVTTSDQIAKATTADDGRVDGTARGPAITVAVDPLQLPYAPVEHTITLTALDEVVPVTLPATLPTAIISGVVDHPDRPPVPGARVSLTTLVGDRRFTTSTISDEDGTYSAEAFQGTVTVTVDEPRAGRAEVTTEVSGNTVVDLMLDGPALGTLEVELLTQLAGDPAPTRVNLNGQTAGHFGLYARAPDGRTSHRVSANVIEMPVRVGSPIRVCANGREAQLPAACVDAEVDPDTLHAHARLELVQAGRMDGRLTWTPSFASFQEYRADLSARILRVDGERRTFLREERPRLLKPAVSGEPVAVPFWLATFEPGLYELHLRVDHMTKDPSLCGPVGFCVPPGFEWAGSDSAIVRVDVPDGAVLDLGDIPLVGCRRNGTGCAFQFSSGSALTGTTISPSEVVPGGVARLRTAAHNHALTGAPPAAIDARMRLDVPASATLVPDSVTLDGEPVPFTLSDDGLLEVAVGTIDPDAQRVLQAWVTVAPDTDAGALWTQGSIVYGPDDTTESLGTGVAVIHRLSMAAPATTSARSVSVGGRGLPDAVVEVNVGGAVAATTTASRGGHWQATVLLPDVVVPRDFFLQARSELAGGDEVHSEQRRVHYDPDVPTLTSLVVGQPGGNQIDIDPTKDIARFPYVWVPSRPIEVTLGFDNGDLVESPEVFVGGANAPAVRDDGTGLWHAQLRPTGQQLGRVSVAWNNGSKAIDFAPDEPTQPLSVAQIRQQLPAPFNTFTDLVVEDGPDAETVRVTGMLPDLDGMEFEVAITSEPATYEPSAEEEALAVDAGVPMYDLQFDVAETADEVTLTAAAFIPDSALNKPSLQLAAQSAQQGVRLAYKLAFKRAEAGDGLYSSFTSGGPYQALASVVDLAAARCNAERSNFYRTRAEAISWDIAAFEIVKIGIGFAAGAAAGPTFGMGTVAFWALGWGLGKIFDYKNGERIDRLRNDILSDPACQPQSAPPEPEPEPCDRQIWFDACDAFADPIWIHDPSGFVYEVFADSRLEGVTATLETALVPEGPWEIWDAEWFGQSNPMLTDSEGRYGWDVPEGWWRVRYDKDGYATAYSEALKVLPPHFDVNVGLTRLAAPELASASAVEDQTFVTVEFDTFVATASLGEGNLTLLDAEGEPVAVTVVPVDPRTPDVTAAAVGDNSGELSRVARVDLGRALVVGEVFTLRVDRMVQSYSGIPVGLDIEEQVTAAAKQTAGEGGDGDGGDGDGDGDDEGGGDGSGPDAPEDPHDPPPPGDISSCVTAAVPPAAFADVPADHVHERSIDCIAWLGITAGITDGRYGPEIITTRGQMASFLDRTITAVGLALEPGRDHFGDDNEDVHEDAINRLAAAGIVTGVTAGQYDPSAPVQRDQFATMLLNAYTHLRGESPAAARDWFGDDDGNVHEENINAAAKLGLTVGRDSGRYAPAAGVRRDQMATFLTRLLELLEQPV